MHLRALSIGYAVPRRDFEAVAHSVFQSAINLRSNNSDHLLTLTSSTADLPQGIRVDSSISFETFHAGEVATCQDGILRLASLTIDLRGARRWICDLPALGFDSANPVVGAAWTLAWNALDQRQRLAESEILADELLLPNRPPHSAIARKSGEAMRGLIHATRQLDLENSSPLRELIGLGSGLTPTGDDLLVGYLAGLWCAVQGNAERRQFISDLGECVIRHSQQTNDISRTYLYHAAHGQVSSLLAGLATAICRAEEQERLLEFANHAMQVGHTSGMDSVAGLLIGLAAWDGGLTGRYG